MSPSKPRHARMELGKLEELKSAGIPDDAILFYVQLRFHPVKRSLSGVLQVGELGLSETVGLPVRKVRAHLARLKDYVAFDAGGKCLYVRGSIELDPATTKQSAIAFGRQFKELPKASPVTREVGRAIAATLLDPDKSELARYFEEEADTNLESIAESRSGSDAESAAESTLLRIRNREPRTAIGARAFEAFKASWEGLYQHPCSYLLDEAGRVQLERQVSAHTEDRIIAAVRGYFDTADDFLRTNRHPWPLFIKDPLKYLAQPAPVRTVPRDCKHQPSCVDAAAHTRRDMAERCQAS